MFVRIAQYGHAPAHPAVDTEGGQAAVVNVGGNITKAQLEDRIWQAVHFNFGQRPFAFDLATLPVHVAAEPPSPPRPSATSPASALRQLAAAIARG